MERKQDQRDEGGMTMDPPPVSGILSVGKLLELRNLNIPDYQRPYKWTVKNINQMFDDVAAFSKKPHPYRLGTVVFHHHREKLDIVDGQQRIVTLIMTVHALLNKYNDEQMKAKLPEQLRTQLSKIKFITKLWEPEFKSKSSHINIRTNFQQITRIILRPDFTESQVSFLLNRCEVVTVTLTNISEAFQFFDSQNSRGKELAAHDLLKAYHLREFGDESEKEKELAVKRWEDINTNELIELFEQYLYRIRNWSRGASARYFGKGEIALFKGVNLLTADHYPYLRPLRIADAFLNDYSVQFERKIDDSAIIFPFQLDQIIINGRRFFEMIAHYQEVVKTMVPQGLDVVLDPESKAQKILETINAYPAKSRAGDKHVRRLFDNLLIFYYDKFGKKELSRAIEKIFIWAYFLRLRQSRVSLASVDRYVLENLENNPFRQIKESIEPNDFLSKNAPVLSKNESTDTEDIAALFEEMKFLNKQI